MPTIRKKFTVPMIEALKPAPDGSTIVYADEVVRHLSIRVSGTGRKTFVLIGKCPGSSTTRRAMGDFPAMSLAKAREQALAWLLLMQKGIDPLQEHNREVAENTRKRQNTFKAVVEDYLRAIPERKRNRHAEQDEREIRRELLNSSRNRWMNKPIADVTDGDIGELVAAVRDRPAPGMALAVLGHIKTIFSWAMWPERRQGYGLAINLTAHLKPKHFGLSKTISTRVLTDDEIHAYWAAADATPYPLGPFYKLLMLSGQRKAEVSDAQWPEFDLKAKVWNVPPERFKSGQSHVVPLTDDMIQLLNNLPRFVGDASGKFLFSTTNGAKPINGFSRAKSSLDGAMLHFLRKKDPEASLPDWVFHDVRRSVRTRLSALRVNSDVAEMVIGHGKTGLRRVYDQHEFEPEMREALDRWSASLKKIVSPEMETNVLRFSKEPA